VEAGLRKRSCSNRKPGFSAEKLVDG